MARGNKNRLLVSGAVLSVALLNSCTSGDEAPPETSRPAVTSEQPQQSGRPNAIREMAAVALKMRDNPPSGRNAYY